LSNLDELFKINEKDSSNPTSQATTSSAHDVANQDKDTTFTTLPFSLMDDFDKHPFRLYDGERKSDMVDSIRDKGIYSPLSYALKKMGDMKFYQDTIENIAALRQAAPKRRLSSRKTFRMMKPGYMLLKPIFSSVHSQICCHLKKLPC